MPPTNWNRAAPELGEWSLALRALMGAADGRSSAHLRLGSWHFPEQAEPSAHSTPMRWTSARSALLVPAQSSECMPPNVPGALDVQAYVGVQAGATITAAIIPAVGADLEVDGFVHLGSDPTGKACWETNIGVQTSVTIKFLDIPVLPIGPKNIYDTQVASGSCPASPPLSWAETFAGLTQPSVVGLAPASNGGSYLAVKTGGTVFVHTNDSGAVDWQAEDTATQFAKAVVESPTDGMVAGGQSNGLPWLLNGHTDGARPHPGGGASRLHQHVGDRDVARALTGRPHNLARARTDNLRHGVSGTAVCVASADVFFNSSVSVSRAAPMAGRSVSTWTLRRTVEA